MNRKEFRLGTKSKELPFNVIIKKGINEIPKRKKANKQKNATVTEITNTAMKRFGFQSPPSSIPYKMSTEIK